MGIRNTIFNFLPGEKFVFVFGPKYRFSGSTIMRGYQLSEICKSSFKNFRVYYKPSNYVLKNSVLFLTKGAIQSINLKGLKKLKGEGNKILMDPVDSYLDTEKAKYADIIIAASYEALKYYKEKIPNTTCMLIDHHVDPRIIKRNFDAKKFTSAKIGYFGELINAYRNKSIDKLVEYQQVDTNRQSMSWLNRLSDYNVHYILRDSSASEGHKPFLKGFTAAHTESLVIAHEDQTDALKWLGNSYPYLIKGTLTTKKAVEMLETVKKDFDTKNWHLAVAIMKSIKLKTSNEHILEQVNSVLKTLNRI